MLYPKRQETYFPFSKKTFIASLKMVRLGIGIPYYKYISKVENKVILKANNPFFVSILLLPIDGRR